MNATALHTLQLFLNQEAFCTGLNDDREAIEYIIGEDCDLFTIYLSDDVVVQTREGFLTINSFKEFMKIYQKWRAW